MPFTCCTKTQNNPDFAFLQTALVNIFHNRRIKKCGRLHRIFHCKIGTDEQFLDFGHTFPGIYPVDNVLYFFKMPFKNSGNTAVAFRKFT